MARPSLIVFTDLDGTLLDAHSYEFQTVLPAIQELKDRHIPLIFCSSKTRTEIERLRVELGVNDPFIVENGGALYMPLNIYHEDLPDVSLSPAWGERKGEFPCIVTRRANYFVIEFGRPYHELRQALQTISRNIGQALRGFGDMGMEELSRLTGLSVEEAILASQREYDEPFLVPEEEGVIDQIISQATNLGLSVLQGGKFAHLIGGTDKGRACQELSGWYRLRKGSVVTAAFGDSLNDLAMLGTADHPFLVEQLSGGHQPGITLDRLVHVQGVGPKGWINGIRQLLARLNAL